MARETKIGIALMVLLVGVFGAMVYKKWNSRKPTAVAAAAVAPADSTTGESSGETTDESTEDGEPIVATTAEDEAKFGGPTPAPPIDPAGNPFAMTETAPPAAQSEPGDPFAEEGFVRSDEALAEPADNTQSPFAEDATSPFANDAMQPVAEAPPAQVEPAADAESPFAIAGDDATSTAPVPMDQAEAAPPAAMAGEPGTANVLPTGAAAADPFAESLSEPATTPTTTAPPQNLAETPQQPAMADDPFADTAETLTEAPATAKVEPGSASAPMPDVEDPFATAETPATAATDGPAEMPAVAEDDPFAAPASIATDPVGAMPAEPPQEVSDSLPAEEPFAADPFGPAAESAAEPAVADTAPGRFPEGAAVPVAGGETPTAMSSSPFDEAVPAAEPIAPAEPPSGRLEHYVVTENDSYWSISKRVYGTPVYFHALAQFNSERVPNPEKLKPGMKILTPPPQELSARFPKLVSHGASVAGAEAGENAKPGFLFDDEGHPAYRVDKDDTLTGIAHAHLGRASRWVQIYEMNRKSVPDPKTLKPGTVLRLPADASRVSLVPEG